MRDWYAKNKDKAKEKRTKEFYAKRAISVRKSIHRSPEAFIRHLYHHISKYSRFKRKKGTINPAALIMELDYDYLLSLYKKQKGLSAISGIKMDHQFNKLTTMSVDRIDSSKGYIPGNVQLVCQWENLAKKQFSNKEMFETLLQIDQSFIRRKLISERFANKPELLAELKDRLENDEIVTEGRGWGDEVGPLSCDPVVSGEHGESELLTHRRSGVHEPVRFLESIFGDRQT